MKTLRLILSFLLIFFFAKLPLAHAESWYNWWYWFYGNPYGAPLDSNPPAVNNPPIISGTPPATATEGIAYSFTPSAVDPEGNSLQFSIVNLPNWASFNQLTGTLTGTPTATSIGLYDGIVISVSDGTTISSIGPFSIMVNVDSSSAQLTWAIPTTRTDGTPLQISEINGFRIYMGENGYDMAMIIDINDSSMTHYTVTNLTFGTYYFAVTTYDADGNESAFSNIASKTIM